MDKKKKIEANIHLIQGSDLYQTIKDILIRDVKSEGLTDYIREQIRAYCLEGIKKIDARIEAAKQLLQTSQNPAQ